MKANLKMDKNKEKANLFLLIPLSTKEIFIMDIFMGKVSSNCLMVDLMMVHGIKE
jgi:hypothetical protein